MLRFKPHDQDFAPKRSAYPFEDGWLGMHNPSVVFFGSSEKDVTSTSTSQPWTTQQPYLSAGFSDAQNLLNQSPPQQVYPVAPFNNYEDMALSGIANQATNGSPIVGAANNFGTTLENGGYLGNNPSNSYFSSMAGSNLGLNNPGASTLEGFANGTGAGESTLQDYASGKYLPTNGSDPVAQSVMAQVVPQIAAQFNGGNNVNNPALTYAASQGASAALAPLEYQNYTTQEGLQQNAANELSANSLTGANSLEQGALGGGNLQENAASGLGSNYNTGVTQMVQGAAVSPELQSLNYSDLDQLYGAGQTAQEQEQNQLSGEAQGYNYSQLSPYQQLAAYMQAVGGNYGGTTSSTTPYFYNNTASTLGGITGGLGLLNSVATPGAFGASGALAGLGALAKI